MKRRNHLAKIILALCTLLLFSGCAIWEEVRVKFDLTSMTGEIQYLNIVSAMEKKDSYWDTESEREKFFEEMEQMRVDDFKEFIDEVYRDQVDSSKIDVQRKFVKRGKRLNLIEEFSIRSLEDFDFIISADSSEYLFRLDGDSKFVKSNGWYHATDSGDYVSWDINVGKIDITLQEFDFEKDFDYVASLLPYWKEWKRDQGDR